MASQPAPLTGGPLVEARPHGLTRSGSVRLEAIDMMRGLVIAIMVLDHVRDFFHVSAYQFDPTDPTQSYPLLYMTRWITHLCAPTFVLLAGVSVYFQRQNGKTGAALSRFLLTRGAWLVLLELTIVMFGWSFGPPFFFLQVIWAIGWAMIAMAALAHLSARIVLALGVALVALSPSAMPPFAPAVSPVAIIHLFLFGIGPVAGAPIFAAYAIVPWLGVMAIGFGLGPVFRMESSERRRRLLLIAGFCLAVFALLRTLNHYGNPQPWNELANPVRTMMFYFNVFKYPPSPDYVAVTLGCSFLLFVAVEQLKGPLKRILGDFGRTPLFTYVAHLYIAHALMLAAAIAVGRPDAAIGLFGKVFTGHPPQGWGWPLGVVYAVWLLVLVILVPPSRWMAGLKRRRRDWWLSYI